MQKTKKKCQTTMIEASFLTFPPSNTRLFSGAKMQRKYFFVKKTLDYLPKKRKHGRYDINFCFTTKIDGSIWTFCFFKSPVIIWGEGGHFAKSGGGGIFSKHPSIKGPVFCYFQVLYSVIFG